MPIKVLLADDSDMMRDAMRRILESERQIEVVGEAGDFGQAMRMIPHTTWIAEFHLLQLTGYRAVAAARHPRCEI